MPAFSEKLTAYLDEYRANNRLPGYDCTVWHHHREIYRVRKGYADEEAGTLLTERTLYRIYSNTKVITCVAALQLMERGLFCLDDPLEKFYPEFRNVMVRDGANVRPPKRSVTLMDVFRMTAGIGDGGDYRECTPRFIADTDGKCPGEKLPEYLAAVPLFYDPGDGYQYGIGHEILGGLVARLSGKTFGEYLRENIFDPLGMRNTAFDTDECESDEVATLYVLRDGERQPLTGEHPIPRVLRESASGGLYSTVDDYNRFQEALCRENVLLRKETTDLMRRNHLTPEQHAFYGYRDRFGYGLGVRTVLNRANPDAVGPYGWGGMAGTFGLIDPENELTIFLGLQLIGGEEIQGKDILAGIVYGGL